VRGRSVYTKAIPMAPRKSRNWSIHLYIWLGTCNLTTKKDKFISLASHDSTTVTLINDYIRKINDLVLSSAECKVTVLELPEYSIVSYNKKAGHNKPQNFTNEDAQLHQQIYQLNGEIRQINQTLQTQSPEFTSDLKTKRTFRRRWRVITTLHKF
jgi:predicted RNA-binding protein with RPS1 domain